VRPSLSRWIGASPEWMMPAEADGEVEERSQSPSRSHSVILRERFIVPYTGLAQSLKEQERKAFNPESGNDMNWNEMRITSSYVCVPQALQPLIIIISSPFLLLPFPPMRVIPYLLLPSRPGPLL
jgi:hypothetical protein